MSKYEEPALALLIVNICLLPAKNSLGEDHKQNVPAFRAKPERGTLAVRFIIQAVSDNLKIANRFADLRRAASSLPLANRLCFSLKRELNRLESDFLLSASSRESGC